MTKQHARPRRVVPSITNQCDRQHVRVRQMNRWPHMDPNPRDSTGNPSTSTHTRHLSWTRLAPLRRHRRRRTHEELVVHYSSCLSPHAYVGAVGPSTGDHKDEEALSAPTGCEDALTPSVRPHVICGRPAFGPLLGRISAAVCSPVNQRFPGRLPSDLDCARPEG